MPVIDEQADVASVPICVVREHKVKSSRGRTVSETHIVAQLSNT